jgi:hypothetical protein
MAGVNISSIVFLKQRKITVLQHFNCQQRKKNLIIVVSNTAIFYNFQSFQTV